VTFLKSGRALLATVILVLQVLAYYGISRAEVIPKTEPWSTFPDQIGEWHGEDAVMDQESIDRLHPDEYLNRVYSSDRPGRTNGLFVAYFKTRRDGRAPHSPQDCLPGAGWHSVSSIIQPVSIPGWKQLVPINEYVVQKDSESLVVHYWYQQNGRVFTNEIKAQFYAMPELLIHGRTDIALIRVITPVNGSISAAQSTGTDFAATVLPMVHNRLR